MILHTIEAGEGSPVVLLHGLFGSARNLGVVQRALASRFRVLALDLRNHGASPHAAAMSMPRLFRIATSTFRAFSCRANSWMRFADDGVNPCAPPGCSGIRFTNARHSSARFAS